GSTITNQMRRLGASVDWSRERFTMDEGLSAAVRKVFVQWYRGGLLYRGKRLVHWDPVLMTAVSDLEVNNEERDGNLWAIRYPAGDGRARRRRRRRRGRRDHASGNDARRRRGRGASRRRALRRADRQDLDASADRPRDPGDRRRLRRSRIRHRRGQDHAGARLQRLADRC